jgi:predicted phosphodiesterase
MRTLLLSDIHNLTGKADYILKREYWDRVVMLGDMFDSFYDSPELNRNTAEWLKPKLWDDKFIIQVGNHSVNNYHYLAFQDIWCSGYTVFKDIEINKVLNKEDWDRFVWYYILDDKFLLTHAGLHRYFYPSYEPTTIEALDKWMDRETKTAIKHLENKQKYWPYQAGRARGGELPYGGWMWLDTSEYLPIDGINQITGHNPQPNYPIIMEIESGKQYSKFEPIKPSVISPEKYNNGNSINLCIDTHLNYYAVYDDGKLEIKRYSDL